jgi:hypothetical protein
MMEENSAELPANVKIVGIIAILISIVSAVVIFTTVPFLYGIGPAFLVPLILCAWYMHVRTKAVQSAQRQAQLREKMRKGKSEA